MERYRNLTWDRISDDTPSYLIKNCKRKQTQNNSPEKKIRVPWCSLKSWSMYQTLLSDLISSITPYWWLTCETVPSSFKWIFNLPPSQLHPYPHSHPIAYVNIPLRIEILGNNRSLLNDPRLLGEICFGECLSSASKPLLSSNKPELLKLLKLLKPARGRKGGEGNKVEREGKGRGEG